MKIPNNLLKMFYNFMLVGMPGLMSNPSNKNVLHAPFLVNSYSTYINYRLDNNQYTKIREYLIITFKNSFFFIPLDQNISVWF